MGYQDGSCKRKDARYRTAAHDAHGIDTESGADSCHGTTACLMDDTRWVVLCFCVVASALALAAMFMLTRSAVLEALLAGVLSRAIKGPSFSNEAPSKRSCRVERRKGGESPGVTVHCSTPNRGTLPDASAYGYTEGPEPTCTLCLVWQAWWCTMWPCQRAPCSAAASRQWTLQRCLRRASSCSCPPGGAAPGSGCTGSWWSSASGKCHRCCILAGISSQHAEPMVHPRQVKLAACSRWGRVRGRRRSSRRSWPCALRSLQRWTACCGAPTSCLALPLHGHPQARRSVPRTWCPHVQAGHCTRVISRR